MDEVRSGPKPWADMTSDERLDHRLKAWSEPDVPFVSDEAREAYQCRVTRLADAICLRRTPDRVPVPLLIAELYPLTWAGLSFRDGMYDFERASRAFVDFNVEFQPDAMVNLAIATAPGHVLELLDYRVYSWPGRGVAHNTVPQYNDQEWMTSEDYDHLIEDPADFLLRCLLPRTYGAFECLAKLGNVLDPMKMAGSVGFVAGWGRPEVADQLERIVAAAREAAAYAAGLRRVQNQLKALGFPPLVGSGSTAPFDLLGDYMRGTRGIALDLYRCPDKVLAACERLAPVILRWTLAQTTHETPPCVFWPLHKGDDAHMSLEQFKTFYWPTLRTVALGLIEEGLIPLFFAEGKMDSRLEIIAADLPKGKTVWLLDRTDMAHAKATLGQVAALQGNVPLSLLQTGTPQEVRDHCRKLIEVAAPGGGFLLDSGAVLHQGKEENVRALVQAAHDYGRY